MSRYVLDSFAVLAFIQQETGWNYVRDMLREAANGVLELHISAINLAEVQYKIMRRDPDPTQRLAWLQALPLTMVSADPHIPQVVQLKARYAISLADCFAVALAQDLDCSVVTGDPEFRKLEDIVKIEWLIK